MILVSISMFFNTRNSILLLKTAFYFLLVSKIYFLPFLIDVLGSDEKRIKISVESSP